MSKINFQIPYPAFIEKTAVYYLLLRRKKKYGVAFRKIKLYVGNKPVKNRCAVVDAEDYAKLAQYHWQLVEEAGKPCYAVRLEGRKMVSMHREIMGAQLLEAARNGGGQIVHHKDGNGLNNTKPNLQIVTIAENNRYCRKRGRAASSKYKGVCLDKKSGKWRAYIKYNGIHKSLGSYEIQEEAARAYDEAAKIYHGRYAVLNFPPPPFLDETRKLSVGVYASLREVNVLECVTTENR
ncbi:MAG: HNH endonuclease [Planctomycetes bacterium]|nr:HNH endonuclease [Planctomycetota bacterium]MBU2457191.1 HNH endonuclease [Planctomycetota bacterium]MBU2596742.1 HNH endonuclease [Planctomycetota bacterium]